MSLFGRIQKFAKSEQGKKLMKQAEDVAKDPKTKQKINEVRDKITHKDEPAEKPPPAQKPPRSASTPPPTDPAPPKTP